MEIQINARLTLQISLYGIGYKGRNIKRSVKSPVKTFSAAFQLLLPIKIFQQTFLDPSGEISASTPSMCVRPLASIVRP